MLFPDYVEEIFQTTVAAIESQSLEGAIEELKSMTPAPMNTMLTKQSREEAIAKLKERKSETVADVPPTAPGNWDYAGFIKNNTL